MKLYIGTKIVNAKPMTEQEFFKEIKGIVTKGLEDREGYLIVYKDGYRSWSPKEVFEEAYKEMKEYEYEGNKYLFMGEVKMKAVPGGLWVTAVQYQRENEVYVREAIDFYKKFKIVVKKQKEAVVG